MILDIKKTTGLLYALFALFSLKPYFIWGSGVVLYPILFFSILTLFSTKVILTRSLDFQGGVLAFVMFVLALSYLILENGRPRFLTLSFIVLALFLTQDKDEKILAYLYFERVIYLILLAGIITIPFIALNITPTFSVIYSDHPLKMLSGVYYNNYIVNMVMNSQVIPVSGLRLFRFSSIFDEPGVVGSLCGLLVVVRGLKTDKRGIVFFIAGALSFSLAFYILTAIYIAVRVRIKNIIHTLALVIIAISLLYFNSDNPFLNKTIISRIDFDNYTIVNNRVSECFQYHYDTFTNSDSVFFGNGSNSYHIFGCDVSSIKTYVFDFGFLGVFILMVIYLATIYNVMKSTDVNLANTIIYIFFLSLQIYQRPDLFIFYLSLIPIAYSIYGSNEKV